MTTEPVIEAADDGGTLQRPEVADVLDDDDGRGIAARMLAKAAGRHRVKIADIGHSTIVSTAPASASTSGTGSSFHR